MEGPRGQSSHPKEVEPFARGAALATARLLIEADAVEDTGYDDCFDLSADAIVAVKRRGNEA